MVEGQLEETAELAFEFDWLQDVQPTHMEGVRMADQFAGVEELSLERVGFHEEVQTPERSLVDDLLQSLAGHSQISKILVAQLLRNEQE